ASLVVTFYTNQADAGTGTNAIADPTSYTSATGLVWVRVVDANGCYNVSSFNLVVKPLPVVNTNPAPYGECEIAPGESVFDLTSPDNQITGGVATLQVRYYENLADAEAGA